MKKMFKEKILSNNKNTLLFIGISAFVVLLIYQIILFALGTYFNSNSDDVAQYSLILGEYIDKFKAGKLSLYNFDNGFGASTFADIYYIPIDIFSILTFAFSYFMDNLIAFSCVELLKVVFGVVVFAYFLQKCNFNNKIVSLISVIYFCSGGSWVFATYPTYFSLFFYLPLCLLVIKLYCDGKKWILPLYSVALVLYNFYNAYSLFVFMVLVYLVFKIRDDYKGVKKLIKDTFFFGMHIVLGVLMGGAILIPSILYIMSYSARNIVNFEVIFNLEIYMHMLYRLFVYEAGVSNLNFSANVLGTYYNRHFSYYMGFLCLYIIILMFFMKDKVSKIYKWSIVFFMGMMCIPIFSMIFSGVGVAYTRWFTFINIMLLYYLAHMLNNVNLEVVKKSDKRNALIIIVVTYFVTTVYNVIKAMEYMKSVKSYYTYTCICLLIFGIVGGLYLLFYFVKQKNLMYGVLGVEMTIALLLNFYVPISASKRMETVEFYDYSNELLAKLDVNENSLEKIYINTDVYNLNRAMDKHTNEVTFHSFMTKHIYSYFDLYKESKSVSLISNELNMFSPYFSRVIDYKYFVNIKDGNNTYMDYMDKIYEDENFVVYENKDYNPFYVYENYYIKEEVMQYRKENNFTIFFKNMFNGVVLEDDEYNLNEIKYNYNDSNFKELKYIYKTSLVKEDNSYVENINFDYNYKGIVYIRGEEINKLTGVKISNKEQLSNCYYKRGLYECSFDGSFNRIVFESEEELVELEYSIVVEGEKENHAFIFTNGLSQNYLLYHDPVEGRTHDLILVDKNYQNRTCYRSLCVLTDFTVDHGLTSFYLSDFSDGNTIKFVYQEDDLSYYNGKKEDIYARNKSLTYNGETINVKYERSSSSDNDQVIVLPITYSEEWKCEDDNYKLVKANGGFLGVIVNKDIKNIDVSITFKPTGVKLGITVSVVGVGIYGLYVLFIYLKKKRGENNENIQKAE